jgi:hypothetical protein
MTFCIRSSMESDLGPGGETSTLMARTGVASASAARAWRGATLNPAPAAVRPATCIIISRREILSLIKPLLCVMIPHSKLVKNCAPSRWRSWAQLPRLGDAQPYESIRIRGDAKGVGSAARYDVDLILGDPLCFARVDPTVLWSATQGVNTNRFEKMRR